MNKLLLVCTIIAICVGLCTTAIASPTLPETESEGKYVRVESEKSESFLSGFMFWLLDDIFGWDMDNKDVDYVYVKGSSSSKTGDSGYDDGGSDDGIGEDDAVLIVDISDGIWVYGGDTGGSGTGSGDTGTGTGDNGWDSGSGDNGWDSGAGDNDWTSGYNGGDWNSGDIDTSVPQTIPSPSAFVLGSIGLSFISWLRRRRSL